MNEEYFYYIYERDVKKDENDLPPGPRIYQIPKRFKAKKMKCVHGPFQSLRGLRKSLYFQWLLKHDPRRANKICKKEHILVINGGIKVDNDFSCSEDFLKSVEHIIKGTVSGQHVSGVHYYDQSRVKILKRLEKSTNGVWSAIIERINEKTGKWVKKEKVTTLFPEDWNIERVFLECHHAYIKREKSKIGDTKYNSITPSGIRVEIIIDNGKLKSIYPLLD